MRFSLDCISWVWKPSGIEETPVKAHLAVCLFVLCLSMRAQTPAEAVAHAPDGGTFTRIQSIAVLPLTNASFSATVTTEWTRILADGSTATLKNHRTIARDSTGRVFEERRSFSPTGDVQPTRLTTRSNTLTRTGTNSIVVFQNGRLVTPASICGRRWPRCHLGWMVWVCADAAARRGQA